MSKVQYLDIWKLISNNILTIIESNNGLGKTYSLARGLIENNIRHGKTFALITRYANALSAYGALFYDKYLEKVKPEGFNMSFTTDSACGYYVCENTGLKMGYVLCLSRAYKYKQLLGNLDVDYIVFDEYNAPVTEMVKGNKEFEYFATLLNCCMRDSLKTQLILLGNDLNPYNIYKKEFNVPLGSNKWKDTNLKRAFYNIKDKTRAETRMETNFGKIFTDTTYIKKALENDYSDGTYEVSGEYRTLTKLEIAGGKYEIGYDTANNFFVRPTDKEPEYSISKISNLEYYAPVKNKLRDTIFKYGIELCRGTSSSTLELILKGE